ncbi:hypothetical protein NFHSH190041_05950 [Shewanella sp. NFH-SH190041]|uniref:DUF3137 domain-containing protein n=1 Tax=Shewanella sp. NFH-SH190041 TaxID=2950245 RepID=UPI0021C49E68|nr:DUF3137 domain-containing protein [Shewanella sp. NFH-SH190041]BDM63143.1 hypothetical protein NFHSH190041_05950 [Shewanella sp. NFH-SH190041]
MMSYNARVAKNIARIRQQVDDCCSQDELVALIEQIATTKEPLDYRDKPYWCFCGLSILLGIVALWCGGWGNSLSPFWLSLGNRLLESSGYWYPALVLLTLGCWLADHHLVPPLPGRGWLQRAIWLIAGAGIGLLPMWQHFYWQGYFAFIGNLLPIPGPLLGMAAHNFLLGGGVLFWLMQRLGWRDAVSQQIFIRDALLNNQLTPVGNEHYADLYQALAADFVDFERGNDVREICALYHGQYQGRCHHFDYQLYKFHYVVKKTVTTKDSEGNETSRTQRRDYYRYGIVLDFPYRTNLCLKACADISPKGKRYRGSSNDFNHIFTVYTANLNEAARLLSPVLEERLTQLGQYFRSMVLQINGAGRLCLAVDNDLLQAKRQHSLKNPTEFAAEIAGHTDFALLSALLDTVHEMKRFCDNNFAVKTASHDE